MKGFLLDTHVWIWSQEAPEEFGSSATRAITAPEHALFVATISTLEIARLVQLGRIVIDGSLSEWIALSIEALGANTLELAHPAAIGAYSLPADFHRDPADRILVATARDAELTLITADARILAYPHVKTLDARACS